MNNDEFWTVVEIQKLSNGNKAALVTAYDDYNQALSAMYAVWSAAAISTIPYHAAFLISSRRGQIDSKIFDRGEV